MNPNRRSGSRAALAACVAALTGCALAGPSHSVVDSPPPALHAQGVTFPSPSGNVIHAWFIAGRSRSGAVLLLHGMGSNRTSMLGRAEFLHRQGFAVLAPDFQAHGESTGETVTFGAHESLDAAAALGFLRRAAPDERVGVIGVSMGGAATLLGPGPLDVSAVVLELMYCSAKATAPLPTSNSKLPINAAFFHCCAVGSVAPRKQRIVISRIPAIT
jgi:pimeloyl-ACP methyl ester carboxylesterase